jgi:hypothetical protein
MQNAHQHTGSAEAVRPSLRNGFTAYIVLSPARPGLFVTVAPKKRELLETRHQPLGRQDHTTSPSVSRALVGCALHVHRIPPHVRGVREPALLSGGTGELLK